MAGPQESLQLLAAFVGVLPALGIAADLALAGKFIRCGPFVCFTYLKGFASVRFADPRLVKRVRDAAGSITTASEGCSLGLGV